MGRDAYLARVALGRSAFGPPLRDENGDLFLGGRARLADDIGYSQQWDDRGHPVHPASEAHAKQYRKAQNEVLEACGVIIRKDTARKLKKSVHELSEEQQAEILAQENSLGFIMKCFDRFAGNFLTWWVSSLRSRLLTFVSVQPTLLGIIHNDFHARPGGFLFKGFLPWVTAEVGRLARRSEISEPVECMNYLQFNLETSASTVREYVYEWAEWMSFLASELPFEFVSTLHALGFSVIRPVWAAARQQITTQNVSPFGFPAFLVNSQFQTTILLYLLRDCLYYQIGWRAYGLFRQLLIRPGRPTRLSVKVAEEDDFVDDDSIIGIGRKLGTHTERRFYGSQTFRSALVIAFPWSSVLFQRKQNQEEIKKNVLSRCRLAAEIDDDTDARRPHLRTRAQNIVRNLESLGVDIEHDFYVDVDQWTRQIDHVQDPYIPITEGHSAAVHTHDSRRQSRPDSENPMFFDSEIRLDLPPPEPGLRRVVSIPQTASPLLTSPLLTPAQDEPSRAQDTEITPRPVRRPTETNMPDPDEEARIEWLVSSQRRSNARKKEKKKDRREYRMTRLTVFSAESFAWHASSLITSLILWPIDSLYFTSLSSWYTSMTGERSTAPMLARTHVRSSLIGLSMFQQSGMVLLCLGMESVVRGVLWQSASQVALYYGRRCDWGKF